MPSRPDANGRNVKVGIDFSRLALLGPGGLLQQVTREVKIGRRLGEGLADDTEAPDVVLFDPGEYPGKGQRRERKAAALQKRSRARAAPAGSTQRAGQVLAHVEGLAHRWRLRRPPLD